MQYYLVHCTPARLREKKAIMVHEFNAFLGKQKCLKTRELRHCKLQEAVGS
jgi:hypothetical protein